MREVLSQMKKTVALFLALVLLLPACASAGGTLRTVSEKPSEKDILPEASAYTGEVRITFLGDCTLGDETPPRYPRISFARRIADNGMAFPFRELKKLTENDDLTVANLEGVLTDRTLKKEKKKFNFSGPTVYTEILTLGSVECVTLANNHSHDYKNAGYEDTKAALEAAGVCWFSTEASAVWESSEGLRIGFLGVNGNLSGSRNSQYRKQAQVLRDYGCAAVITVMHAGTEYDTNPPDSYQKQITSRAVPYSDLIIGHHPHIVQGYTVISGVPVVYSLGNCVFGGNTRPKDMDALVVQAVLHFTEGVLDRTNLHFYPIMVTSDSHYNNYSPRLLTGKEAERVLRKMVTTAGGDPGSWDEKEGAVVSFPAVGSGAN